MSIGSRKDWDEYLQKCLCRIPPGPPTSIIIKKITESPVDSGAPSSKKGQTMLAIKGFTPLVLALLAVAEPSLGFIQKGTLVVPYIQDFNPLILPKPIQGISSAPSPKALESSLPSPIIINLKMFSLEPNLQTQESMVIHMLNPFPYPDSHYIPRKYDVTLISTRTRKENVCSNTFSSLAGLTRSGRCYTP